MSRWIVRGISLLLICFFFINLNSCCNYNKQVSTTVRVVEKYQTNAEYKVSARWILIVQIIDKNPNHKRPISIDVTPATFWECNKGGLYSFKLSEGEMNRDNTKELMEMLSLLSLVIGGGLLLGSFIDFDDI